MSKLKVEEFTIGFGFEDRAKLIEDMLNALRLQGKIISISQIQGDAHMSAFDSCSLFTVVIEVEDEESSSK